MPLPNDTALRGRGSAWSTIAACATLALAVWLAHGEVLGSWFAWDETLVLDFAWTHAPWEAFARPSAWQELSAIHFTPWVVLSLGLDLSLFGLDAMGYFAHHLGLLWLVACATYMLLRLWCAPGWAWAGALLFTCSAPVFPVAHKLTTRHYVEGLLFSGVALILWCTALRDRRARRAWAALACAVPALACKEIYAPILVLMPCLAWARGLPRRFVLAPLTLLAAYVAWRWYMLGALRGGIEEYSSPLGVLAVPWRVLVALCGSGPLGWAALAISLAGLAYLGAASRTTRWVSLAVAALALAPLTAISDILTAVGRYELLPAWCLSIGLATAAARIGSRGLGARLATVALLAVVGLAGLQAGSRAWTTLLPAWRDLAVPNRFLVECDPDAVLFIRWPSLISWLRREMHDGRGPQVVNDELPLSRFEGSGRRIYRFLPGDMTVSEITDELPTLLAEWRQRLRDRPLSVRMVATGDETTWELGPWIDGKYFILGDEHRARGSFPVPRVGGIRHIRKLPEMGTFRIRYDSPEGWITYSEPLALDARNGDRLDWSR